MSGSGWGRHSKSCCKTSLGNLAVSTAWQISRGPATLLPQVCEMCFVIYQGQKKWWENGIFTIRVLSRLTTLLTWAASLGWTSAVICCNIYREYYSTYLSIFSPVFLLLTWSYVDFARSITQIVFHTKCNQTIIVLYGWQFCSFFVWCCLTCSNIMRISPVTMRDI